MTVLFNVKLVLAAINVVLGLLVLAQPRRLAALIGLQTSSPLVLTELRVQFGGLYIALGGAALLLRAYPTAWLMLGLAYAGMALTRIVCGALDRHLWNRVTLIALLFELVCAGVFIAESGWFVG